ncbi:MAG: dTDP-4-dehydrorhamnose 3,5-epimerase [Flavobacteriaceae bacterium]|jgi:dTDP-4-dehydrorhamnose 3,5-epimerase|nr:dTDP-4-dehydrorhamnose 3,5-epimerase [Flavobacteriaceae bacterium]
MEAKETYLKGCFVISPKVFNDKRGYFFESFNKEKFESLAGISIDFVQDNQSLSSKGVLRGLHFQTGEFEQAKLVRTVKGSILDVCVDLRKNSKTFGQYFSIILDDKNHQQLFIPRGFAHGFLSLENNTIINYKCDNYYNKNAEKGIVYNDKTLNIDWNIDNSKVILSDKDKELPDFDTFFS